jgi:hypothetical protein
MSSRFRHDRRVYASWAAATFVLNSKWRVVKSERVVLNTKLPLISAAPPETDGASDALKATGKDASRGDDDVDSDTDAGLSKRQRRRMRGKVKGVPEEV